MASNATLLDGKYGRGFYSGRPRIDYPFSQNGDYVSVLITRDFLQSEATYQRGRLGVDKDPKYSTAYLIAESQPEPVGMGDAIKVSRVFATVPREQTVDSTIVLNKPNPESVAGVSTIAFSWQRDPTLDTFIADGFIVQYNSAVFTRAREVYFERAVGTPTITTATGGTFTITYNGQTTASLAYNESDANIAAAINALSSIVSEGITVSVSNTIALGGGAGGGYVQIDATVGTPAHRFSATNSLTPSGAGTFLVQKFSATRQFINVCGRISLTGHGFSSALSLYARRTGSAPAAYSFSPTQWAVVDANTVAVNLTGGIALTDIAYIGQQIRTYTPGAARVRIREVQSFYLPGVTAGISSVDDIPIPEANSSDSVLLTLAADPDLSGFQVYDATRLGQWRGSPIYEQTLSYINIDNL